MKIAYTIAEAAGLCSLSENNLRDLIRQGRIVARQCGSSRALRIGHAELERFFTTPEPADGTVATVAETVATPGAFRRAVALSGERSRRKPLEI